MKRNASSYFSNVPTPSLPRNRFDLKTQVDLGTLKHGRLQLVNSVFVYPGDTWERAQSELVQADTYAKFPLDSVEMDTYDFFVPLREIDPDFKKVFGDVDAYDTNVYTFPEFELDFSSTNPLSHDTILKGAGWSCPVNQLFDYDTTLHAWVPKTAVTTFDKINPYTLMAYYYCYNEYFRDNNVDPIIPIEDLKNNKLSLINKTLFNNLEALPVNKFHDRFTSGLLSPQKAVAGINQVTIPLGLSAPVLTGTTKWPLSMGGGNVLTFNDLTNNSDLSVGNRVLGIGSSANDYGLMEGNSGETFSGAAKLAPNNLYADLSQATGASIDSLRIAFAIQELAEIKSAFGSRMSSYYRGVWGIEVPDYILDRPEYLGGHRFNLNMVPVLNQDTLLGAMAAHSRTISDTTMFTKSFWEFGILIRVACTRIHHTYSFGITNPALRFKDELDLYNRKFANLGNSAQKNELIYNDFTDARSKEVFNYNEFTTDLKSAVSTTFGDFSPMHGDSTELFTQWSFQDIYTQMPVFSAAWLKEDDINVRRTMTGRLLPNATNDYGHQYMVAFIRRDFVTRPVPAHPHPAGLTNRI